MNADLMYILQVNDVVVKTSDYQEGKNRTTRDTGKKHTDRMQRNKESAQKFPKSSKRLRMSTSAASCH
jgi:hypothetical protein